MVARKFVVQHGGSSFDLDYDTEDGFEVLFNCLFPFFFHLGIHLSQTILRSLFNCVSGAEIPAFLSNLRPSRSAKGLTISFLSHSVLACKSMFMLPILLDEGMEIGFVCICVCTLLPAFRDLNIIFINWFCLMNEQFCMCSTRLFWHLYPPFGNFNSNHLQGKLFYRSATRFLVLHINQF